MQDRLGRGSVGLSGGRVVDVWLGGDPRGVPVLFFHGTPGGRLQAALGAKPAMDCGVLLMAWSRPGYGQSSDAATTVASVGADALELAVALNDEEFGPPIDVGPSSVTKTSSRRFRR